MNAPDDCAHCRDPARDLFARPVSSADFVHRLIGPPGDGVGLCVQSVQQFVEALGDQCGDLAVEVAQRGAPGGDPFCPRLAAGGQRSFELGLGVASFGLDILAGDAATLHRGQCLARLAHADCTEALRSLGVGDLLKERGTTVEQVVQRRRGRSRRRRGAVQAVADYRFIVSTICPLSLSSEWSRTPAQMPAAAPRPLPRRSRGAAVRATPLPAFLRDSWP